MKILVCYPVTGARWPLFERAWSEQGLYGADWFDSAIVTDHEMPVPRGLVTYVVRCNPWTPEGGARWWNISIARNMGLDLAIAGKYEWTFFVDGDVILPRRPSVWPRTGFARVPLFRQPQNLPLEEIRRMVEAGSLPCGDSSQFLLGAEVLPRVRWCQEYFGYGWEDLDFVFNVLARYQGIQDGGTDARAVHLWHDDPSRNVNPARYEANRRLFETRAAVAQSA
jgi:hypothetical protein